MFYRTVLLAAVALTGAVNAQSRNETGTGPEIDPNSVPIAERQGWCRIQTQNCPRFCGGRAMGNQCDPVTLTFSCICDSGNSPNTSDYQQSLPAYVCRTSRDQCTAAHPNDAEGQAKCQAVECGNKTSEDDTTSTSSSASSSQTSSSATSSGSEASETASSTNSDDSASATSDESSASNTAAADSAAAALNLASNYGTGLLAAGILAAFGLAL